MIRILEISLSDIAYDPAVSSQRIGVAGERNGGMKVVGMACIEDRVQIYLEPFGDNFEEYFYRFAPFDGLDSSEIAGEVSSRYSAGFSTLGLFFIGDKPWGLFRKSVAKDTI